MKKSASLFFERVRATLVAEVSDSEALKFGPQDFPLLLSLIPGLGETNKSRFAGQLRQLESQQIREKRDEYIQD